MKALYPLVEDNRLRIALAAAGGSMLTYLLISSSTEFSGFAPFETRQGWLYLAVTVFSLILGWASKSATQALALLTPVIVVPVAVYGVAIISLPVALGRAYLFDVLVLWAFQRAFVYLVITGVIAATGVVAGISVREVGGPPR
ncbi:MAG: hypothetical protein Q8P50_10160 [Bacillota bacterium]|nr:hypothetical protein [Bacillota bacterium]